VKVYFSTLLRKVGVSDRFELALYAMGYIFGGHDSPALSDGPVFPVAAVTMLVNADM